MVLGMVCSVKKEFNSALIFIYLESVLCSSINPENIHPVRCSTKQANLFIILTQQIR